MRMGELKGIHLGSERRDDVLQRRAISMLVPGLSTSLKFNNDDRVTIFVGETPLAEGIIINIYVGPATSVKDQYVEEVKRQGLKPRDNITLIEWKYVDPVKGE